MPWWLSVFLGGCSDPPPPPPPAEVPAWAHPALGLSPEQQDRVVALRHAVGVAARTPEEGCEAVRIAIAVAPELEVWLAPPAGPDASAGAPYDALATALPGLTFTFRSPGVRVEPDWVELGRAAGGRPGVVQALVSVGGLVSSSAPWRGSVAGVPCADHDLARAWVNRLERSLAGAPACIPRVVGPAVDSGLADLTGAACLCGEEEAAREQAERTAQSLERMATGAAHAERLRRTLKSASFGKACLGR